MFKSGGALASILLGAAVWAACSTGDSPSVTDPAMLDGSTLSNVTQHCPSGGVKTNVDDAFTGTTRTFAFTVGSICIKAGTVIHETSTDGTFGGGCYTVSGLGTTTITFAETGAAGCKDISYYQVYPGTTPSPSPSPSPNPSPSPSPSPNS